MNTTEIVIKERQENPCATLQQLGDKANVCRERARQILKKERLSTRHFTPRYICLQCGKDLAYRKRPFCSWECKAIYNMIPVECSECGTVFYRTWNNAFWRLNRNVSGVMFCSKQCQGKYCGKNFGFLSHPENAGNHDGRARVWDYAEFTKLIKAGLSSRDIHDIMGVPYGTFYNLRKKLTIDD